MEPKLIEVFAEMPLPSEPPPSRTTRVTDLLTQFPGLTAPRPVRSKIAEPGWFRRYVVELDDRRNPELKRQAIALLDSELDGEPDYYEHAWNSPQTVARAAVVEIVDHKLKVVAAAYAQRTTGIQTRALHQICGEELQRHPTTDPKLHDTMVALEHAESVGFLCALAVAPEGRRRGFARALVESRSQILELMGCDVIWADAWERDTDICSIPMFERLGWQPVTRIENLWIRLADASGEPCPVEWNGMHGVPFVDTTNRNMQRLVARVRQTTTIEPEHRSEEFPH